MPTTTTTAPAIRRSDDDREFKELWRHIRTWHGAWAYNSASAVLELYTKGR